MLERRATWLDLHFKGIRIFAMDNFYSNSVRNAFVGEWYILAWISEKVQDSEFKKKFNWEFTKIKTFSSKFAVK